MAQSWHDIFNPPRIEPFCDDIEEDGGTYGTDHHLGIGQEADKTKGDNRSQPHDFRAVEAVLPPKPGALIPG
jgi:hypothetical protein